MRPKVGVVAIATVVAMALAAAVALAASPHFNKTSATQSGSSVTVSFKASGLGNVSEANFSLSATATAVYGCFTKSGHHPSDTKKEGPSTATVSGTFPVRNGTTSGSLTLTPPASTLSCPNGQHVELMSGSYENVTLSGEGISASFGDFSF
jgi:hypothetical protein